MAISAESRSPVRQGDVKVLIGIIAILDGNLRGGDVDERTVAKFASRFVDAGLLARDADGSLPSAGRVAVAMDYLIERLRFALGEYDSEPEPAPGGTAHVLLFPTEAQAANCKAELQESAANIRIEADPEKSGWRLSAVYPELAPDPGFMSRERTLQTIGRRFGGFYSGSQTVPR